MSSLKAGGLSCPSGVLSTCGGGARTGLSTMWMNGLLGHCQVGWSFCHTLVSKCHSAAAMLNTYYVPSTLLGRGEMEMPPFLRSLQCSREDEETIIQTWGCNNCVLRESTKEMRGSGNPSWKRLYPQTDRWGRAVGTACVKALRLGSSEHGVGNCKF